LCFIRAVKREDAEPLFQRAIAICQKVLGAGHGLTHRFQAHFARLLLDTGRAAEALAFAEAALAIQVASSGPNHRWTRDAATVTADALDELGRKDEAAVLRMRYSIERGSSRE